MTAEDKTLLTAERDAIKARLADGNADSRARAQQDLGERLAHLEARLKGEDSPPVPETPPGPK